jgi:hypothetical protein
MGASGGRDDVRDGWLLAAACSVSGVCVYREARRRPGRPDGCWAPAVWCGAEIAAGGAR